MKALWLRLAGQLLAEAADQACSDWSWPSDWSDDERYEMAMKMVEDNADASVLSQSEINEVEFIAKNGAMDWKIMSFLADRLKNMK